MTEAFFRRLVESQFWLLNLVAGGGFKPPTLES